MKELRRREFLRTAGGLVAVIENELRETRGPSSRVGILIGPETRDIRCEGNRIEGFAVQISDLRKR